MRIFSCFTIRRVQQLYLRGRDVRLVVDPPEPLGGDHGAVVVEPVLLVVDDPAVATWKKRGQNTPPLESFASGKGLSN